MWSTWARPPSSAVAGVQQDGLAVFRDGDGRVPVEVVGQLAQGADERPWRRGRWCSTSWRFPSGGGGSGDGGGRACGGGEGLGAAGPGGVVGQGDDVGVGQVGDLDPFGDAAFGDEQAFAGVGRG